jgi:hypothetical protein
MLMKQAILNAIVMTYCFSRDAISLLLPVRASVMTVGLALR